MPKMSLSIILSLFLISGNFEPRYSYKQYCNKKKRCMYSFRIFRTFLAWLEFLAHFHFAERSSFEIAFHFLASNSLFFFMMFCHYMASFSCQNQHSMLFRKLNHQDWTHIQSWSMACTRSFLLAQTFFPVEFHRCTFLLIATFTTENIFFHNTFTPSF